MSDEFDSPINDDETQIVEETANLADPDVFEEDVSSEELEREAAEATEGMAFDENATEAEAEEMALRIVKAAASLKVVKINRDRFIRSEMRHYAPYVDVELAAKTNPIAAGIVPQDLDKIACAAIDLETRKCAGLSFLAGIPGGVALAGTVPADLAQYFAHIMRIEQKLAYLYGWGSFLNDTDEVDDATIMELVSFMGVMMEVGGAASSITKFATNVAQKGVAKTIERQALAKTTFYPIMKSVLRVLGVNVTKQTFAKTVSKVVPVLGGAMSGTLTYATFKPGAERLRKYLRTLPVSGIDVEKEPDGAPAGFLEVAAGTISDGAQTAGAALSSGAQAASEAISEGTKVAGEAAAETLKNVGGIFESLLKK